MILEKKAAGLVSEAWEAKRSGDCERESELLRQAGLVAERMESQKLFSKSGFKAEQREIAVAYLVGESERLGKEADNARFYYSQQANEYAYQEEHRMAMKMREKGEQETKRLAFRQLALDKAVAILRETSGEEP